MSTSISHLAPGYLRDKRLLIFAVTAFLIGSVLRLSYPADIEYKSDEQRMFEKTQAVAQGEAWPATGMVSSQRVVNPGLSVWVFIWGCGILITAVGMPIQRHYLAVAFPLVAVWLVRFLDGHERWGSTAFGVMWAAQLLVSLLLMYYIHVNGGAPIGGYNAASSALPPLE